MDSRILSDSVGVDDEWDLGKSGFTLFLPLFKDQQFFTFQPKRANLDLKNLRTQTFEIVLSVRPGDLVKI